MSTILLLIVRLPRTPPAKKSISSFTHKFLENGNSNLHALLALVRFLAFSETNQNNFLSCRKITDIHPSEKEFSGRTYLNLNEIL